MKLPAFLRRSRRHGMRRRFMATVFIGALLFSAVAGGLTYRAAHRYAVQASLATLQGLAEAVEKTVAIGAYAGDQVLLREVAEGLARNDLVAAIEMRSPAGALLAGAAPATAAAVAAAAQAGMTLTLPLASPFDSREPVGVLRIVADGDRVDAIAKRQGGWLAALMAGQAALLALLLYAVGALLVSQPIVRLSRQLQALPPGTRERLATPAAHRHDEIGLLIDGANALLDANSRALERERALLAEVQVMEAQYRQIFDSSSAGIFVLDQAGQLINGNPTVSKVVGLSVQALRTLRQDFIGRIFGQPEKVRAMVHEAARRGETVSADLELVQHGLVRRWVHCLISVQTAPQTPGLPGRADTVSTVEGVIYDITERKRAETAVRYQAEHDSLTALKNRAASELIIDRFVYEALADGAPLALLCIDLDGFKQINDSLGHLAGDEVLRVCAERMRSTVRRASDLVGRIGGDEFIVALRGLEPDQPALAEAAAALLAAISAPIPLPDGQPTVQVGCSIGIACLGPHGLDRLSLTQAADEAMYAVKETGKNAYAVALSCASVLRRDDDASPVPQAVPARDLAQPQNTGAASDGVASISPSSAS